MSGSQASAPQAQTQTQTLPRHVVKFLREKLGLSLKLRKCVDRDFMTILSAVLLADGKVFDYRIYSVAGNWHILHVWMPDLGGDMAIIARFNEDYELEECFMIEEE